MTRINATDPMQGAQEGRNVQSQSVVTVLPGASPLFQLSWLREVFRYRNQEYGAYSLRQQYPRNMMWGGLLSISLIGLLYGGSLLAQALQEKMISMREITIQEILPPPAEKEETPPPPPVAPPPQPAKPTITFVVPKVTIDEEVIEEYEPPTQKDMENKNPGTVTTDGNPDGTDYLPEEPIESTPPPVVMEEETKPKEKPPFVFVEQMPAFRGNLGEFLAKELRYPEVAKENGVKGTVVIQFVVNEKGEITNPFILKDIGGGCGEEALRVVRSMPPWLAGAQRGVPVKVQMNLPIRFVLE